MEAQDQNAIQIYFDQTKYGTREIFKVKVWEEQSLNSLQKRIGDLIALSILQQLRQIPKLRKDFLFTKPNRPFLIKIQKCQSLRQ